MSQKIGIIGLGLIGGSLCKAIKKNTSHTVFGYDTNENTVNTALDARDIDGIANKDSLHLCDYIIIALYPKATIDFITQNIKYIKKGAVIIDCAGVKENLCSTLEPLCKSHDVHFIGGHPMAGIEKSGFEFSFAELFKNASMILCPAEDCDFVSLKGSEYLFSQIGFRKIVITTPEKHDKLIAFTSQLAHIVSNAYIKSDCAKIHRGFSAGSFKDLTRVAYLNENMWTELFFHNKSNLNEELCGLIERLTEYKNALLNDDKELMRKLLSDGKKAKVMSAE